MLLASVRDGETQEAGPPGELSRYWDMCLGVVFMVPYVVLVTVAVVK